VKDGKLREVGLKVDKDITVLVKTTDKNKIQYEVKKDHEFLKAPVAEGTRAGKIEALLNGETIASADVLTAEDVARVGLLTRLIRWFFGLFSK
jgi:D-alanyl-D-alanine carboxypeptidase